MLDKGVTMVVELLENKKRWDQFVETSPQGSLFHKWDFLKIVERHSKYQFLPYCVYSGEQLRCIFPLFTGRDRGLTVMNSPPPHTQIPYLGPAFDPSVQASKASEKEKILNQVTDEVCREIDTIAPNFVSITTVPNFLDIRFFIWKKYREHVEVHVLYRLGKIPRRDLGTHSLGAAGRRSSVLSAYSPEIQQTDDVSALLDIVAREVLRTRGASAST